MKFSYNSRIIKHLGYELITSDEVAITELIKNSYDAGATKVSIQFLSSKDKISYQKLIQPIPKDIFEAVVDNKKGLIIIEDDGKGMSYATLQNGFFEVGGTLKKDEKQKLTEDADIILGEKGIGRLAAQRISPTIIVETSTDGSDHIDYVIVNWEDFVKSKDADAPEATCPSINKKPYTRLWLIGTNESPIDFEKFFEKKENFEIDIFGTLGKSLGTGLFVKNDLHTALSFLYSPFESNKSLLDLSLYYDGEKINHSFDYKIINIAESIHSLDTEIIRNENGEVIDLEFSLAMKIRPWFIERIHHGELGRVLYQDWKRQHSYYETLLKKYQDHYNKSLSEKFTLSQIFKKWNKKYNNKLPEDFVKAISNLAPIEAKIYSFKRDKALISMAIESAIENKIIENKSQQIGSDFSEFLSTHNGIKLYRNSFRIGTIGNKDNDWLKLQQKRTTGVGRAQATFDLCNDFARIGVNALN